MNKLFFFSFLIVVNPNYAYAWENTSTNFAGLIFAIFVFVTLLITYYASKKNSSKSNYYAAGEKISGFQNGLAIAGDYMSAASFFGGNSTVTLLSFGGIFIIFFFSRFFK